MRILALVINHGTYNMKYCRRLIASLHNMPGYSFTVRIFSSEPTNLENCEEIIVSRPQMDTDRLGANSTGFTFIESLYDHLRSTNLDPWDYVLLTENDLLFTKENLDYFFKYSTSPDYTIGFLRYEEKNGSRFLLDCGMGKDRLSFKSGKGIKEYSDDKTLIRLANCHQGCWFLPAKVAKRFAVNRPIPAQCLSIGGKYIESGEEKVSGVFYSEIFPGSVNGIKKFTPIWDFEKLLIHHQPNKYINIYTDLLSVESLINERGLRK